MMRPKFPLPFLTVGTLGVLTTFAVEAQAANPFEWTGTHAKGDFDNDGALDRVASSPETDCNKGSVYVLDGAGGSITWTEDTSGVLGTAACDDYFGAALAVGDFDGDGFDDLAIGTPGASDSGSSASGSVHILYGSATGLTDSGDQLWHQDTSGIEGVAEAGDQLGSSLASGDFNCDGYDDLAIGTPTEAVGATAGAGAVNVIFGSSTGLSTVDSIWYQGTGGVDDTAETDDHFGAAVAAGNFNGDMNGGYACDDLAIGAPDEDKIATVTDSGYLYIIDGTTSGLSSTGDQGIDQDVSSVADTAQSNDQLGLRLDTVRVEGDSYDDLWVTTPGDGCTAATGWGRHQFRGSSGGLSFADDAVDCNEFECAISGSTFECETARQPVHASGSADDVVMYYGSDVALGWAGADDLTGSLGRDILIGGLGNDSLDGGANGDILIGGSGDDEFWLDLDCEIHADDVVDGGPGTDVVYSHLSSTQLATAGVTLVSIESFVTVSEDDSDEEYTCGLPDLAGTASTGYACFDLEFRCDQPTFATLKRDGTAVWEWAGVRDDETSETPSSICIDTDDVASDTYDFTLSQGCDGGTQTSLPVALATSVHDADLVSVTPDQIYYQALDEIVITIETTGTGLVASADFSALDSNYTTSDEDDDEIGTGVYEVSYTLSATNTRPSGDHWIPWELRENTGALVRSGRIQVRFLPDGPMRTVIPGGSFSASPPSSRTRNSSVSIVSVTDLEVDTTPDTFDEDYPDFSDPATPIMGYAGRVFALEIETTGTAQKPLAAIVVDTEASGHYMVPLTPSSATCAGGTCSYEAPLVIASRKPGSSHPSVDLEVEVVELLTGVGSGPDSVLYGGPDPDWEYQVNGTVTYTAKPKQPVCNSGYQCGVQDPDQPLQNPEGMIVRLITNCMEPFYTFVDPVGEFELPFMSACGDEPARLRISSWLAPEPYPIAVADRAPGEDYEFPGGWDNDFVPSLSDDPMDYRTYTEYLRVDADEWFTPDDVATIADPFVFSTTIVSESLANAVHIGKLARQSLRYQGKWIDPADTTQMNILADYDEVVTKVKDGQVVNDNTNSYHAWVHPGFIHVAPWLRWSEFGVHHEMGHFIHEFWTAEGDDYYGRFGEPMAHIHAASVMRSNWMATNQAENLDYNGSSEQAEMHFYASINTMGIPNAPCDGSDTDHHCCNQANNIAWTSENPESKACMMTDKQGWYWRIFYDLADGTGPEPVSYLSPHDPDFDEVNGYLETADELDDAIMDVVLRYLGGKLLPENLSYVDRGIPHTDIVDVLDGMKCRGHMTNLQATVMLHDVMTFQYDFMGPGGCG